jgi:hypothetical protein
LIPFFQRKYANFIKQQKMDMIKTNWAQDNGVPLFRIAYNSNLQQRLLTLKNHILFLQEAQAFITTHDAVHPPNDPMLKSIWERIYKD